MCGNPIYCLLAGYYQHAGQVAGSGSQTTVGTFVPSPAHALNAYRALGSAHPSIVDFHLCFHKVLSALKVAGKNVYAEI